MDIKNLMPLKEAAKEYRDILGSYRTLQNRIYAKKIPHYRIGSKLFINPQEVLLDCKIPSAKSKAKVITQVPAQKEGEK